jgi:hypothetical protein
VLSQKGQVVKKLYSFGGKIGKYAIPLGTVKIVV